MKRFIACLLCLLMASFACGCGQKAAQDSSATSETAPPASSLAPASSSLAQEEQSEVQPGPYASLQICRQAGEGGLRMRAQPNTDSEILCTVPQNAFVLALKEEGDWAYCCCGTYFGWMSAEYLDKSWYPTPVPVPDFLTEEQQLLFIEGVSLFNAYSTYVAGEHGFVNMAESVTFDDGFWGAPDWLYTSEDALRSALESVFTPEYVASESILTQDNTWPMVREQDGKLYCSSSDRGSWGADVTGYTLLQSEEDAITFDVHFLFGEAQEWTCTLPIELVRTADGWRFSSFTTGRDDLRWMEQMGSNFDPWVAMGN